MTRIRNASPARLGASLALLALLGGCAVGPNFHDPAAPAAAGYTTEPLPSEIGETLPQSFAPGAEIPADWWTLFGSAALNARIERALKNNPDLAAAKAALRVARETYLAQRGAYLPTVDTAYGVTRQQASSTPAPPLTSAVNLFTLQTAQVNVGFTPDVFGGLRRQTETVAAQAEAQRFETEAAYLTLTSNVVAAAIQEASLREQIAATARVVTLDREMLAVMRRQMAVGQIGGGDVAAQEAALAQAEQALPPLKKQLAQQLDLVSALMGGLPSDAADAPLDLAALALPQELPVSLPSKLVAQRPDVRVAAANLHAASAQVGVAIAARLPSFSITANAGGAATNVGSLFTQGNGFWSLGAAVAQPIFQGGALMHRQRAAEAGLDQAKAQYRSTVIAAFQNVADTLQALHADADALDAADRAERAAKTSLMIARKQLEVGAVSGVSVMLAEQAYQQALISRAQALASRYADTAGLYQALGGGWWRRG